MISDKCIIGRLQLRHLASESTLLLWWGYLFARGARDKVFFPRAKLLTTFYWTQTHDTCNNSTSSVSGDQDHPHPLWIRYCTQVYQTDWGQDLAIRAIEMKRLCHDKKPLWNESPPMNGYTNIKMETSCVLIFREVFQTKAFVLSHDVRNRIIGLYWILQ